MYIMYISYMCQCIGFFFFFAVLSVFVWYFFWAQSYPENTQISTAHFGYKLNFGKVGEPIRETLFSHYSFPVLFILSRGY